MKIGPKIMMLKFKHCRRSVAEYISKQEDI